MSHEIAERVFQVLTTCGHPEPIYAVLPTGHFGHGQQLCIDCAKTLRRQRERKKQCCRCGVPTSYLEYRVCDDCLADVMQRPLTGIKWTWDYHGIPVPRASLR